MEVHKEILVCDKCALHEARTKAVPGSGFFNAPVMFVGEGPGRQEDLEGLPFVGAAGKYLGELLSSINLKREDVFITNVVKCRPPGNRDPLDEEKEICLPYLRRQVSLIKPAVICPLGNHALKTLVSKEMFISKVHGQIFKKGSYVFFTLYHPAAALYDQKLKKVFTEDFEKLGAFLQKYEYDK
jgi:uracil-DNA glycosylase